MNNYLPPSKKLEHILNSEQIIIYKNLTKNNSSYFAKSNYSYSILTLKITNRVFVFIYKNKVIKIIFNNSNDFKNELYYSHLLYQEEIISKSSSEGCILILPNYGSALRSLRSLKLKSTDNDDNNNDNNDNNDDNDKFIKKYLMKINQDILEQNLVLQIIKFHSEFIVHNDIKPGNIIVNNNYLENKLKYIIIDFGLTSKYKTYLNNHNLAIGTSKYRPNKQWRNNFDKLICEKKLNNNEIFIYMFLKDWYAFSKTVNQYGINSNIHKHFENCEFLEIIKEIKILLSKYKIELKKLPFYLNNV